MRAGVGAAAWDRAAASCCSTRPPAPRAPESHACCPRSKRGTPRAAQAEGPLGRVPTEDATEGTSSGRGDAAQARPVISVRGPTPGARHLVVQVEEVGVFLSDVSLGVGDELADVPAGTRGNASLRGHGPHGSACARAGASAGSRRMTTRKPCLPGAAGRCPLSQEPLRAEWGQVRVPGQRHALPAPRPALWHPPGDRRHCWGTGRPLTRRRRCPQGCPAGSARPSPCSASGTAAASPCKTAALRAVHAPHPTPERAALPSGGPSEPCSRAGPGGPRGPEAQRPRLHPSRSWETQKSNCQHREHGPQPSTGLNFLICDMRTGLG